MIIRAVKKLISTSVFGCPRLYFSPCQEEQTSSRAASRRGVRPGGAFYFARVAAFAAEAPGRTSIEESMVTSLGAQEMCAPKNFAKRALPTNAG
jgi:hypothetical protein